MASIMTKRQQARNEKALQDLIKTVPGNDKCADCAARNPGWASWSLGIFICMRCAALHRKVGTHVSKVKSLSMDSWSNDQVEHMKRTGNVKSNQTYNSRNVKPDLPVDMDEAEVAMEKYIRQKYDKRAFASGGGTQTARHNTGSTSASSLEDQPPPLPPKPGKKFGFSFRSTSSALPQRHREDRYAPPLSPNHTGSDGRRSPIKANKQSRILGSTVGNQEDNFDAKLVSLREMGFKDSRRNSMILKSFGGNLDRTVGELVRLGESSKGPSRALTPVSASGGSTNGITVEKRRTQENTKTQLNPFDALDMQPPQRSATSPLPQVPSGSNTQPNGAYNPYLQQTQPQQHSQYQPQPFQLQDQFANLQVSQSDPSLGVQATGVYNSNPFMYNQQPQHQTQQQQLPQQSNGYMSTSQNLPPSMPISQQANPFLRRVQSQNFAPSNPWMQNTSQQAPSPAPDPWGQQQQQQHQQYEQQQQQNPYFQQPQQHLQLAQTGAQSSMAYGQSQQDTFTQVGGQQQSVQNQNANANPFMAQHPQSQTSTPSNPYQQPFPPAQQYHQQQTSQPQQSQQQFQHQMQNPPQEEPWQYRPQQQSSYQQPRYDKSSILALYNQTALPPSQPLQQQDPNSGYQQQIQSPQRSVTMPISSTTQQQFQPHQQQSAMTGNMNPFGGGQGQGVAGAGQMDVNGRGHISQESAAFVSMGNAGGRASPDAFANLSSRWR